MLKLKVLEKAESSHYGISFNWISFFVEVAFHPSAVHSALLSVYIFQKKKIKLHDALLDVHVIQCVPNWPPRDDTGHS